MAFATVALSWCFDFATPRLASGAIKPALHEPPERDAFVSYEQALIVHDPATSREHLFRQLVFSSATREFGFIVPTPTRPSVGKVDAALFQRLTAGFPFRPALAPPGGWPEPARPDAGATPERVRVLEEQRVGNFKATMLSPDDEGALTRWLAKEKLASSKETNAWLAHYVRAKYFFVVLRYSPGENSGAQSGRTLSEVVRLSFDSPLPFFPYSEPALPTEQGRTEPRMLELTVIAPEPLVPVALLVAGGTSRWVRPFNEGYRYTAPRPEVLREALGSGAELLSAAKPSVQRFVDQKRSRGGFGDVVLVPSTRRAFAEGALTPLVSALDPSLAGVDLGGKK